MSEDDLEMMKYVAAMLSAGLPSGAFLQLARVYGQALAQIADAEVRLVHLYVHEPLMRAGMPSVEVAEEMEGLVRALADLAGYARLTVERGDAAAVSTVERFVTAVEQSLPSDARVIKTLGDEVMVVGSDAAALTEWAVALQASVLAGDPPPRIGIHLGEALYRDGDYYGRDVNQAARVVARAGGGEVLVTRPVVETASGVEGLEFVRIGEVRLKGFSEPTELFTAAASPAP